MSGEAAVSSNGHGDLVLPGDQGSFACYLDRAGGVPFTATVEVWSKKRVTFEFGEQFGLCVDFDVDENNWVVGVGDELFGDLVEASRGGTGDADGGSVRVDVGEVVGEVALLFVNEGFFVREEELHIAGLGAINGGIVDFVQGSMG